MAPGTTRSALNARRKPCYRQCMANSPTDPGSDSDDVLSEEESLPALDFTTFVLSLSTTVLGSLGELPEPNGAKGAVDLPSARQTVDLLALLQLKTRGNLTGEEERLLNQVLLDLRMRVVQVAARVDKKR